MVKADLGLTQHREELICKRSDYHYFEASHWDLLPFADTLSETNEVIIMNLMKNTVMTLWPHIGRCFSSDARVTWGQTCWCLGGNGRSVKLEVQRSCAELNCICFNLKLNWCLVSFPKCFWRWPWMRHETTTTDICVGLCTFFLVSFMTFSIIFSVQ